jgi:hypothetical protein
MFQPACNVRRRSRSVPVTIVSNSIHTGNKTLYPERWRRQSEAKISVHEDYRSVLIIFRHSSYEMRASCSEHSCDQHKEQNISQLREAISQSAVEVYVLGVPAIGHTTLQYKQLLRRRHTLIGQRPLLPTFT